MVGDNKAEKDLHKTVCCLVWPVWFGLHKSDNEMVVAACWTGHSTSFLIRGEQQESARVILTSKQKAS